MNLECQTFDGTLEIIRIRGGPITDVEHEEMDHIIEEARHDAAKNGIQTNIQLKKVSYYDFLREYDPASLTSEGALPEHTAPELPQPANHREKDVQVTALRKMIEQKDEVIEQKDDVIERKDEEIALLKEQLKKLLPSEGLPPE